LVAYAGATRLGHRVGPDSHEQLVRAGYFAPPAGNRWASSAPPPTSALARFYRVRVE